MPILTYSLTEIHKSAHLHVSGILYLSDILISWFVAIIIFHTKNHYCNHPIKFFISLKKTYEVIVGLVECKTNTKINCVQFDRWMSTLFCT